VVFFNVFFKTLGFLSAILIFLIITNILLFFTNDLQNNKFTMIDGDGNSKNIIARINLNGPIFNRNIDVFGGNFYDFINPLSVKSYLEELKKLKIKALVVNINSPGGTVSATAELENIFSEFKKETNTKLYFFTKEVLASGGYWVATSADKIFASYGSIIGSIGVSGPSWFYYNKPMTLSSGVFGQSVETKNGIEVFNQNAGQSKDLFNPYRPPNNDEIKHLQKIVDEVYEDFVTKVSKSRKIDIEFIKHNVGALIYSSNQALDNFLIDDILEYNTLITYIVNENKLEDYKIFENKTKKTFIGNFFAKYSNDIDSWSIYKNICKNLELSVSVIIPTFYKNC
tara:strand:- start:1814 stop:2836 length:1023 start_codon:yes stop_codon:yes gene_type:complete